VSTAKRTSRQRSVGNAQSVAGSKESTLVIEAPLSPTATVSNRGKRKANDADDSAAPAQQPVKRTRATVTAVAPPVTEVEAAEVSKLALKRVSSLKSADNDSSDSHTIPGARQSASKKFVGGFILICPRS
jgi:hypothetical protein